MSTPPGPQWKRLARYAPPPAGEHSLSDPAQFFSIPEQDGENRSIVLIAVATETGLPIDFSEQAMRMARGGFVSVRTSAEAIPRGSLVIMHPDGRIERLADYKTTSVGSKSKLRGMGKGKLLWDRTFFDQDRDPEKVNDPKDNNSHSKFPDRIEDTPLLSGPDFLRLQQHLSPDLHEAKFDKDTGLIYCSINVAEYDSKKKVFKDNKEAKHYCQEAEALASIFYNIDKGIYKKSKIEKEPFIYFKDDNNNECRIDLSLLRLPPELKDDPRSKDYEDAVAALAKIKNITALNTQVSKLKEKGIDLLELCHVPIFTSKTPTDPDSFVPVLVQTGDNGEQIIRDADFEHFYRHPLIPPLAQKSFNGGMQFQPASTEDHRDGLELLNLRLSCTTIDKFKSELKNFIEFYIASGDKAISLDDYTVSKICELYPYQKPPTGNTFKLSDLSDELQQIVLLAKYNDLTTLDAKTPYVNYMTEEFEPYRIAVNDAREYYMDHDLALENIGEASIHGMVFLHQLDHPMSMHDDEGIHPKGKPEDFARITTYCNGKAIVTNNEEQYLKLLLTNPEMLQNQVINIHPYWLRNLDKNESSPEYKLSKAWLDLLTVQALRQGLILQEYEYRYPSGDNDTIKGYDIFVQSILLNMPRRFLSDAGKPGDEASINNIRQLVEGHFADIKTKLLSHQSTMIDKKASHGMERMVEDIYSDSPFKAQGAELEQYRVYPHAANTVAMRL